MIKKINFIQYKKFKNISLSFKETINIISGTNGTCKSSLLYIISNSFQSVNSKCNFVNNNKCLKIINSVNNVTNPKIEGLTRGDKQYNDPSNGIKGTIYTVEYFDNNILDFRRHNSGKQSEKHRYALKPKYPNGSQQKLPNCPVLYLGLSRLLPYGEYNCDSDVTIIKGNIPSEFYDSIAECYNSFTHLNITGTQYQHMGALKNRASFVTDKKGIDSNTISAGEDNLFVILTALESLKYYYENINSEKTIESILIIDEIDATLHPAFQIKLLNKMREYAVNYKIQIFMTTHSLSLIEEALRAKDNLIYLVDNENTVYELPDPTIQKINAQLRTLTTNDIYKDKIIPILTEDKEARFLIQQLFNYFEENKKEEFKGISRFFVMPDINIGGNILQGLFKEQKLINSRLGAICILDGDKTNEDSNNLSNCIMTLPGKNCKIKSDFLSPEELLFNYSKHLFDTNSHFWLDEDVIEQSFTKAYFKEYLLNYIQEKTHNREENKKIFNEYILFFEFVFKHWLYNSENANHIEQFYKNLKIIFQKVAPIRGINPKEWK